MIIYHGSRDIIERPRYGMGRPHNDYGLGFYCTEELVMAQEWAVDEGRDGFANSYALDTRGLSILRLGSDAYTTLHWLAMLLENREFDMPSALAAEAKDYLLDRFSVPYRESDIVIGYRADDSYFSFAQDFLNGTIHYRQLTQAMHLGKLGQQVVLKSERSFERLSFCKAIPADSKTWFPRKQQRDRIARHAYRDVTMEKRKKDDLFILTILNEEIGPDDPRLR